MTLIEAQAKLDAILKTLGVSETQFQSQRVQYPIGDSRLKEIAFLEGKIAELSAPASAQTGRCNLATFRRD